MYTLITSRSGTSYKKIIIVDATMDGQPAGTISLIIPKRASDYPKALSVHDVGLKDMIEALYIQECLPEIHLITVSVSGIQPMVIGMTDSIEASIPETIETLLRIAKQIQDPNHSPLPQDT